ncbi:MAG: uroporphyrinogen-III C-methyltransferase [Pirellula sp.]|jgi:uroporphyrinogen III methyltransferase/synthase|nr:uroporphyrinogen-III C-methyltransferase [Pirellula sp.]
MDTTPFGKVYLIGAGPGDPQLITLKGVECLHRCDIILYDGLANPLLLKHAKADAITLCVGKHGHGGMWTQQEINKRIIEFAKLGKSVARLKGGDTAIFARTAEEVEELEAANIPYEIVPGITAAMAATAYAGIPLTHRDWASAVAFVTGQLQPTDGSNDAEDPLDWHALARFPGTLVMYMGVTTAEHWSRQLIAAGKPASTPVALLRRISWPDQQVIRCELGNVGQTIIALNGLRPPVISIVGDVVASTASLNWFVNRPLFGKKYLVASTSHTGAYLTDKLRTLGAEVVHEPALEILPPVDWTEIDQAIDRLASFDWIVLSSVNGVDAFMSRLFSRGLDGRSFGKCRIASVGTATSAALQRWHLIADCTPQTTGIAALIDLLKIGCENRQFLFVRTASGKQEGLEALTKSGAFVQSINVYRQIPVETWPKNLINQCESDEFDGILVTSSNIAESICKLIPKCYSSQRWFSLSAGITRSLETRGCTMIRTSQRVELDSLVDCCLSNATQGTD